MHLGDGYEHAVAAGILQVEIVLRRAENRLGAQSQILTDTVHGVDYVVADP